MSVVDSILIVIITNTVRKERKDDQDFKMPPVADYSTL
jgi:hypothetical protein